MANDVFTDDDPVSSYLADLERDACYRVERVLKESASEVTEVVYFMGANGAELGPFVRKRLRRDAGLGSAYRDLYQAQCHGRRFRRLPRIYACREVGDELVVVMEHVSGETLSALVQKAAPGERLRFAALVMPPLCEAACELHEGLDHPVVHRDLTPANVLCSPESPADPVVIDLGISRAYRPGAQVDTAYFGTRVYAPPEQYGFGQTSVRTDVYALGMTCFFCLTGRAASNADRACGFGVPGVPDPVAAVIDRACCLTPEGRYANASELGTALAEAFAASAADGTCARSASEAGRVWARLTGLVPLWAGDIWNTALVGALGVLAVGCVAGLMGELADLDGRPVWYAAYEYLGFMLPSMVLLVYALLDKRRLRRMYAWMRRRSPGRERALCALAVAGLLALWVVVGVAVGTGGA